MQFFLWTLALLSILGAAFFCYRADRSRSVPLPWLTAGLRALLVALVWALLLSPTIHIRKNETEQPIILFLQDESASIPAALNGDTAAYQKDAEALLAKLSEKYQVLRQGFGAALHQDSLFRYRDAATDIATALSRVSDAYSGKNVGAIILATDGRYNLGQNPLEQNLEMPAPLYGVCIGDTARPIDLCIPRVYAPRRVAKGAQVAVRADLTASGCKGFQARVRIHEGSSVIGSSSVSIPSDRFDQSVPFSIRAGSPGLHHYVLQVDPAPGEKNTANNRRDFFIEVLEQRKRILIAAAAPHPDIAALRAALEATDAYTITVKMGLPEDLSGYDVVILQGIPESGIPALKDKPVWEIMTQGEAAPQSRVASLRPAVGKDEYAVFNPAFNAFSVPPGLNPVFEKLPPLRVAPFQASPVAGAEVLFQSRNEGTPLWLVKSGRPSAALLMGEGLWRWRLYEFRYFQNHAVVDECIRQTVALLAANTNENPLTVSQPKFLWSEGEPIRFDAYLLNEAAEQMNTPDVSITITDSAGHRKEFDFDKQGAAYRLDIGPWPAGTYAWQAHTDFEGKHYTAEGFFVVSGLPLEAMESGADYALLYGLSKKYGGHVVLRQQMASLYDSIVANKDIRPVILSRESSVPLVDWKWYFFLILLVAAAEWLLRKYWLAQ
ncbi:MAG: hypothetical protein JST06_07975 [Bacteroidetes bacterium]|nr:hypothetical protein [Bacteroidota bacterium]MBS1630710.1 hypothetical protein [Bacteroidota bacterium]